MPCFLFGVAPCSRGESRHTYWIFSTGTHGKNCCCVFLTALASLMEVPQSCQGTERTHGRKWIQEERRRMLSSLMVLHVKPGTSKGFKKKKSDNPDTAEGSFYLSKGNTLHLVVLFTWVISMHFQRWPSCISFCSKYISSGHEAVFSLQSFLTSHLCMLLIPLFKFSTRVPVADSRGERRFNSIKSGSCVTPDPIRLLAAVHEPDPHDNVARDSWRDG